MKFKIPLVFTVLWLVIFSVMVWAGFWQLDREKQKQRIVDNLASNRSYEIKSREDFTHIERFLSVELKGRYSEHIQFLLENKIHQGKVGYQVLTPFYTHDLKAWIIVNRGWAHSPKENIRENIGLQLEQVKIKGIKSDFPKIGFKLGEIELNNKPLQSIAYFDQEVILPYLKARLCSQEVAGNCIILPFMIKLDPEMEQGFVREWKSHLMPPEKHRAYAAQWFTMSLVLLVVYWLFLRKINANTNKK